METEMIWPEDIHAEICLKALGVMRSKSHDYAGHGDPYRNFRMTEVLGLGSMEAGIVIRITDKVSRIAKFTVEQELKVKDEQIEDTIIDLINYLIIYEAINRTNKLKKGEEVDGQ